MVNSRETQTKYGRIARTWRGASAPLRMAKLGATPELQAFGQSLSKLGDILYSRYGDKRADLGGPSSAFGGDTIKAGRGQLGRNTVAGGGFEDYMRLSQSGEVTGVLGQPLPPLTKDSVVPKILNTSSPLRYSGNAFSEGLTDTVETGRPFFQRTPQSTTGMNIGQRLQYAAGRAAGDVLSDASRTQYWRFNHPYAVAREGFGRMAGGSKLGGAAASFAGIQALGQTSGAFDLTNPGQAFRPKGMQAAYPSDKDLVTPENPVKELLGRYVLGRGGRLLPYDQFSQERPDVSRETYQKYDAYLKARPDAMPPGTFDLGGLGVLKGTSEGINGPEIRFANTPVTPGSVVTGLGTATATAGAIGAARNARAGVVTAPGPTVRVAGRSVQLGKTNPALAIGTSLIAAGSELQGALKDKAGFGETLLRVAASPVTSAVGAIAQPIQKAWDDTVDTAKGWGNFLTGKPVQNLQRNQEQRDQARAQSWDEAPKKLVRGLLGQPAQAAPKPDVVPNSTPTGSPIDQAYSQSGDRLARASAEFKLVTGPDGKTRSVRRAAGDLEGVRGVVTKVDDGDTYRVRQWNRDKQGFEEKTVRVANIDTRETADHASSGDFQNRMINKQKKDQGFTSDGAVFRQGEKDKQAAAKLVKVGDVVRLSGVGEAAHDRVAAKVGEENSGKDVGDSLVATGNAVPYVKKESAKSQAGGVSSPDRLKIAQLQHGAGGSADRGNATKIKIAKLKDDLGGSIDRTNSSKERIADTTGRYKVQTADVTGQYKVKTADVTGIRRIQQEVVKQAGQNQTAATTGQYKVKTADVTGIRRIQQEGVKQEGGIRIATIRGQAQMGAADITARGRVATAATTGEYRVAQEGVKQEGQAYTQGVKNVGTVDAAMAKNIGTIGAASARAGGQVRSAEIGAGAKVRVAEIGSIDRMNQQRRKAESDSNLLAERGAQDRARIAHTAAARANADTSTDLDKRLKSIQAMGRYW
jgi:hypothetical protein